MKPKTLKRTSTDSKANLEALQKEASKLLDPSSQEGKAFFLVIQRRLRQYRLDGATSVLDVSSEAYLRAHLLISSGKTIQNVRAWFMVTALNIIREISRSAVKERYLAQKTAYLPYQADRIDEIAELELFIKNRDLLAEALKSLSAEEKKIINLRVLRGLAWSDVRDQLNEVGDITVATVRKRGSRALSKLKAAYLSISENTSER